MESRRASQWGGSRTGLWIGGMLVAVLVIVFFTAGWTTRAIGPKINQSFRWFRSGIFHRSDASVSAERDQLRAQLQSVTKKLLQAEQQLETVQAVSELDTFVEGRKLRAVYGQVIAYSPDPGVQSVTINRGSRDHIESGLVALSGDGFVIGTVRRVTSSTATILLITDPQTRIVSKVRNEQESRGLVQGEQGLSIRMSFIPKHEPIDPGQLIVTSGTEQNIPVDLPIGTIGKVQAQSGGLFQTTSVVTPVDIQNLDVVAVIPAGA